MQILIGFVAGLVLGVLCTATAVRMRRRFRRRPLGGHARRARLATVLHRAVGDLGHVVRHRAEGTGGGSSLTWVPDPPDGWRLAGNYLPQGTSGSAASPREWPRS